MTRLSTHGALLLSFIDVAGRMVSFLVIVGLASRLRWAFDREARLAHADDLTGLLSRRAFYSSVEAERARRSRRWQSFAVLYMDCDNFKQVNDQLGHHEGARLLRWGVDTIRSNMRRRDLVARLGCDEFAVFFPTGDDAAPMSIASHLMHKLRCAVRERYLVITFSMGVAVFHRIPSSLEAVIVHADRHMYAVKGRWTNGVLEEVF